jgi:hypothetical protein
MQPLRFSSSVSARAVSPVRLAAGGHDFRVFALPEASLRALDRGALVCALCNRIKRAAVMLAGNCVVDTGTYVEPCGHSFCGPCLQRHFACRGDSCPTCARAATGAHAVADRAIRGTIRALDVVCLISAQCSASGPLGAGGDSDQYLDGHADTNADAAASGDDSFWDWHTSECAYQPLVCLDCAHTVRRGAWSSHRAICTRVHALSDWASRVLALSVAAANQASAAASAAIQHALAMNQTECADSQSQSQASASASAIAGGTAVVGARNGPSPKAASDEELGAAALACECGAILPARADLVAHLASGTCGCEPVQCPFAAYGCAGANDQDSDQDKDGGSQCEHSVTTATRYGSAADQQHVDHHTRAHPTIGTALIARAHASAPMRRDALAAHLRAASEAHLALVVADRRALAQRLTRVERERDAARASVAELTARLERVEKRQHQSQLIVAHRHQQSAKGVGLDSASASAAAVAGQIHSSLALSYQPLDASVTAAHSSPLPPTEAEAAAAAEAAAEEGSRLFRRGLSAATAATAVHFFQTAVQPPHAHADAFGELAHRYLVLCLLFECAFFASRSLRPLSVYLSSCFCSRLTESFPL